MHCQFEPKKLKSNSHVSPSSATKDTHCLPSGSLEERCRWRALVSSTMSGPYDDLIARLESISEEISDLGMERLRASIETDAELYGKEERQLGKARRAVEKAAGELRVLSGQQWSDDGY